MPFPASAFRSRVLGLLGLCGLALGQTACAHPVAVEPSVVVHARLGGPVYGSVHVPIVGPVYGPPPVLIVPPPRVIHAPPRAWVPPGHRHHGHGHGRWHERRWGY